MNQNPEQIARDRIDTMLEKAGWVVQSKNKINLHAAPGVAIREYQTSAGPADYALFAKGKAVGIIEAKKEEEGHRLTVVEEQSAEYARAKLKWVDNAAPLPFVYESTGEVTRFTDYRDPKPASRPVFHFHKPDTLLEWFNQNASLRKKLQDMPLLGEVVPGTVKEEALDAIAANLNLRLCQFKAISNLEESFRHNRPRALIQMATGAGKTYTAITAIYRLLKYANAKRILFLVDTKNLGEQAEQEFTAYTPIDDNRKFTELYSLHRLRSSYIPQDSCVCISTVQRLYSILKGEELEESAEESNPNELFQPKEPVPVGYNEKLPVDFFDFIVIDECHRSIYNLWKQVLDYFDAFLIGLTATPDKRTFAFFNQNVVSEYKYEKAVADGILVPYNIYSITTEITANGARIEAGEFVDKREKLTRRQRWEQLDEELVYAGKALDRDIVNPSVIRTVIRTFKEKLFTEIFPGRKEIPKTLIFAKSDSHADDIIQIVREEFGEGNEFCKKVTYKIEDDPQTILRDFRGSYNPRIAVTVDMIATGTDIRPLECLLFMRDVKSRTYYEQMLGRGTRTCSIDDMRRVDADVTSGKTHFIVVDAIGVTKTVKVDTRPLEKKPGVPLKDLMHAVMMGSGQTEEWMTSLANRLARLDKQITAAEKEKFSELEDGKTLNRVIAELLNAFDEDQIEERLVMLSSSKHSAEGRQTETLPEGEGNLRTQAQQQLIQQAASTFTGPLIEYIDNVRKVHEQTIDTINLDAVQFAGWDVQARENAEALVQDFKSFIEQHKDELTALQIFYNQPFNRREVTFKMVKDVLELIKLKKPILAPAHVWKAYEQLEEVQGKSSVNELVTLVALLRRITGIDPELTEYSLIVNRNFKDWVFRKNAGPKQFTPDQMDWLNMIKEHIITSIHLEQEDLDYAPFDAQGGVGKMWALFGEEMDGIINELNEILVA